MVDDGGDAGVRPDVESGFDHVDEGIERKNDPHECHGDVHGSEEGGGEKEAAHRNTGIANGSEGGEKNPGEEFEG